MGEPVLRLILQEGLVRLDAAGLAALTCISKAYKCLCSVPEVVMNHKPRTHKEGSDDLVHLAALGAPDDVLLGVWELWPMMSDVAEDDEEEDLDGDTTSRLRAALLALKMAISPNRLRVFPLNHVGHLFLYDFCTC
jgi:hypothetical protein